MQTSALTQSWLDKTLYPFEHKYVQLQAGNMHFVDEGVGETILFVHGTPTWSFLYRDFIKDLSQDYRCIAVDHLGFGLSDKPDAVHSTPQWHANNLSEFINKLDLKDITLVVHDFGGPIGLASAIANESRIKRVVMFNTWLWETNANADALKINKIVNGRIGKFLYLNLNFSAKVLLKQGFAKKKNLSRKVHKHYTKPFPNKSSRIPLLDLAKALVGSSDWYQAQWQQLSALEHKPWLTIWGTKDKFITTSFLQKWQERLPNLDCRELACGHFVQEEKTEESIQAIRGFMER